MTLFFIIAFKASVESGGAVAVYLTLRFYLCLLVCAPLSGVALSFFLSVSESLHFTFICFLLLYTSFTCGDSRN